MTETRPAPSRPLVLAIEHWKPGAAREIYARLAALGRGIPDAVIVHGSWVDEELRTCWQVMSATSPAELDAWRLFWGDLMEIEIVPVLTGTDVRARIVG